MEHTLGSRIVASVILDRDYRSQGECDAIAESCKRFCDFVAILKRKEIENFLLVPPAIDRAAAKKVTDRVRRTGQSSTYKRQASDLLDQFASGQKAYVAGQMLTNQRLFERANSPQADERSVAQSSFAAFEQVWSTEDSRLRSIPGKDALSAINAQLQEQYSITVTATSIIDAMLQEEVPNEMVQLLEMLRQFVRTAPSEQAAASGHHSLHKPASTSLTRRRVAIWSSSLAIRYIG
jgi:hypothetical protein